MNVSLDKTWQFLERLQQAVDRRDVETILIEIIRPLGFSSMCCSIIPTRAVTRAELSSLILAQRLPARWIERYMEANHYLRDPIVHRLRSARAPFTWNEAYQSCSSVDDVRVIRGEVLEFGLSDGYVVPISLLDGNRAALSFGGHGVDLNPENRSLLEFVAGCAVGQLLLQRKGLETALGDITVREYDCLRWAAEGKSEWAIAQILAISKPTVTKHLSSAREKLGALTRSHAVAIAFRKGIIR